MKIITSIIALALLSTSAIAQKAEVKQPAQVQVDQSKVNVGSTTIGCTSYTVILAPEDPYNPTHIHCIFVTPK
jgi:hypothetical protein